MDPKHDRPRKRIDSLQGLRACGFLAIFFSHSVEGYASFGAAGVSIFLILSGFLLTYGYLRRDTALRQPSPAGNLRFAVQKLKKLYPLHLFTMLLTLCLILLRPGLFSAANEEIPVKTVLNLALLQAWAPKSAYYFSLNSVSWYLSTAGFTYLIFPWLLVPLRRMSRPRSAVLALLAVLALEIGLSLAFSRFGSEDTAQWFSLHWLTYIFPLFRLLDFTIGALFGFLFLHRLEQPAPGFGRRLLASCAECLLILALFLLCRLYPSIPQSLRYSAVFLLPSALLIYLLACGTGYLSLILSRKPFQLIGALSASAFLFHQLVIRALQPWIQTTFPMLKWYVSVLLLLIVTLLLSAVWDRLQQSIEKRRVKSSDGGKR